MNGPSGRVCVNELEPVSYENDYHYILSHIEIGHLVMVESITSFNIESGSCR